jgi:hypothetical protein
MIETRDEGYMVIGVRAAAGAYAGFMYKIDLDGNKEWLNFYYGRVGKAVVETADGGYAVTGEAKYTCPLRLFTIKTDEIGNVQWEILAGCEGHSPPCSIIQTVDEGFALMTSWPSLQLRGWDFYLCKISPYPRHNVAVSGVRVSPSPVQEGLVAEVDVTIGNDGDYNETTQVLLYDNSALIGFQNATLSNGTSKIITFFWNTTEVELGQHIILANATGVTGETYFVDNIAQTQVMIMEVSKVSISTVTSSALVGLQISISGTLTNHREKPIPDELILLSYEVLGTGTWNTITSAYTDITGHYSAIWIPTATGYFSLKAEWTGNATYFGISSNTTLSVVPYNQYVFAVESNSTISALAFNSTANELSFFASGLSGTKGYTKVTLAKSLVANATNIRVYLDGNQTRYSIASTDDSWLLTFNYTHSTHKVAVKLNVTPILEFPSITILLSFMLLTMLSVVILRRRKTY